VTDRPEGTTRLPPPDPEGQPSARRLGACSRPGLWRAILLGIVVVLGVQGCTGAPSVNLGSWVRSPYIAKRRNATIAAFASSLSALRQAGLTPQPRATADGCGQYSGGNPGAVTWGVTCSREVVVTVAAPHRVQAAQAIIVRALTTAGWRRWHGTLATPGGCSRDDLHGVHAELGPAALTAWRLTCSGNISAVKYGPAASGCPAGPMEGLAAWSWHERVCRPIGVIAGESAQDRILISMFAVYADVNEGTSTNTAPPDPARAETGPGL
jgi:hypothetical protein